MKIDLLACLQNPKLRRTGFSSLLIVVLFTTIAARFTNYNKIVFHNGDIASAQKLAKEQRKLYFVDFGASWCSPCKLMEETTYKNALLANYINDNYIPVKVDVDDFDGFVYKKKYNIKMLPTILIFNEKGEIVGRKEEAQSASELLAFLKSKRGISRPPLPRNTEAPKLFKTEYVVRAARPELANTPATRPTKVDSRNYDATVDGKYYGVQVSVVSKQESVEHEVKRLKNLQVGEQIIIVKKWRDGAQFFHVMLGKFADKNKAVAYKNNLKSKEIGVGLVKMFNQI